MVNIKHVQFEKKNFQFNSNSIRFDGLQVN